MPTQQEMAARIAELEAQLASKITAKHVAGIGKTSKLPYDGVQVTLGVGKPVYLTLGQAKVLVQSADAVMAAVAAAVTAPAPKVEAPKAK